MIGNVGRDPEIKTLSQGSKVANLSVATSEIWKDKAGDRKERTEWHRIAVFNQHLVDVVEKYVSKGSKLYIEGSIQSRKYTGKDGVERTAIDVVIGPYNGQLMLLDSKNTEGPAVKDEGLPF